ncbi:MAG TPA: ABC transporter ATP-binding protein [Thermotogota bacterium]|nr:ABC transporter ATP-binding protein [Thermotogota bacterium]
MLDIKRLTKVYGKSFKAVDDLSLSVKKGEIFGFLGPNGAGKTTTIKMIVGLLKPTEGSLSIGGKDILKETIAAKLMIGYVPDEPILMEKIKGIEYLDFIADIYGVSLQKRRERVEKLSAVFKLQNALQDIVSGYSHGMKQKLSLIAALLHQPELWILDEPLTGLDPESAFLLKKMMRNHVKNGNTVFFSTHLMEIAERVCDRIGIIHKGKLLFTGTIEELKETKGEATLEQVFLEVTGSEAEQMDFSYLDASE